MRVLFCGTFDPGTPRARQYLRLSERAGYEVEVANYPVWGLKRDSSFGLSWLLKLPELIWAYLRLVNRLVRGPHVDVVVFLYPGYLDAILLGRAARRCGKRTVLDQFISVYDTVVLDRKLLATTNPAAKLLKLIDVWSCHSVDLVVFDTPQHLEFAGTELSFDTEAGAVLWVSADPDVFVRNELVPVEEHVLFYGTFIPLHGTETIIRAAAMLPDVEFHIIGKGQQSEFIDALLAELGVTNVTMIPPVSEAELVRHIQRAKVCLGIFGTTSKAQRVVPNKVFQCCSMGKAVITEASPAIDDSLQEVLATVTAGDAAELAEQIRNLMEGDHAEQLGRLAKQKFDRDFGDRALGADLTSILAG